jgi:hypothetical protein
MKPRIKRPTKTLSLVTILVLTLSPLFLAQVYGLQLTTTPEYANYVHSSTSGNYTVVDKPIFPVTINNSQIPIGGNWTITCPLQAGHNYHIYCYGAWINTSTSAKTNYDIYVYAPDQDPNNPSSTPESSHTEAAGLPEHLGTTVDDALFTPTQTGNYSFVICNNPFDSQSAQQATFMIIENLETDKWYTSPVDGEVGNDSSFFTNWAYEFLTNQPKVELYVKVPQTIDMYEARLYLMNTANSPSLNSVPLPWEPGLYGNVSNGVGGYNFESNGYEGVASASCEYFGQAMFLTYTSNNTGLNLYHLMLMGQVGSGDIEFMLKSHFGDTALAPKATPIRTSPNMPANISYMSNGAALINAQLSYTTDNWGSTADANMTISNQTCSGTIPGQKAGSNVQYRVNANDELNNNMIATGNYSVKQQFALNITAVKDTIQLGQNVTITGALTPNDASLRINVQFLSPNSTETVNCLVNDNGTFEASYKPDSIGAWVVMANSPETQTSWRCDSGQLTITVAEPPFYVKYSLFIVIGIVAASAVGGAVWFLKFRK